MKKNILALALLISTLASSCASTYVYKGSEKQAATKKVLAMRADQPAKAKALQNIKDGNIAASGVDLTFGEILKERPYWQAGAVALDVTTAVLLKSGYDNMTDDKDSSSQDNASRSADKNVAGGNQVIVQGNAGGDINVNLAPPAIEEGLVGPGLGPTPVGK